MNIYTLERKRDRYEDFINKNVFSKNCFYTKNVYRIKLSQKWIFDEEQTVLLLTFLLLFLFLFAAL